MSQHLKLLHSHERTTVCNQGILPPSIPTVCHMSTPIIFFFILLCFLFSRFVVIVIILAVKS